MAATKKKATPKKMTPQQLMAEVQAKMGKRSIMLGNDPSLTVTKVTTGMLPIDILLDGGIPFGRMVEFSGDWSTLKSVIGYSTMAQVQKSGGTAALIDTEHAYEPEWAERIGIDTKNLMLWPDRDDDDEHTGEEALDIAQVLTASGVDLIVFDSVAAAYPQDEAGKPMSKEKVQPGRLAQMMSKGLRRLTAANDKTAFIFINQTRMNIGVTFGSPETTTGGKALPYYASMRVVIRKVGKITRPTKTWDGEKWMTTKEQTGQVYKAELQKSKLSKPFKEVWFTWSYDTGQIDLPGFLIAQLLESGDIVVKGNTWTYGNIKVVGREKFKTAISADPELVRELERVVRERNGLPALSTPATSTKKQATVASASKGAASSEPTSSRGKRLIKKKSQ